uniref:Uncharacterized protein n=1 Tax=Arundo donax TaxID=35708 RepID=A0A0A9EZY0_ARUDO
MPTTHPASTGAYPRLVWRRAAAWAMLLYTSRQRPRALLRDRPCHGPPYLHYYPLWPRGPRSRHPRPRAHRRRSTTAVVLPSACSRQNP